MIKFQDNGIAYINCPKCDRKIILREKWREDAGKTQAFLCLCGHRFRLKIPSDKYEENAKPTPEVKFCPYCGEPVTRITGDRPSYVGVECSNKTCPTFEFRFNKGSGYWMPYDVQLGSD